MDSSTPARTYTSKELELATVLAAVREGLVATDDLAALTHEVRIGKSDSLLSAISMAYGIGASDLDRLENLAEDFLLAISPTQLDQSLSDTVAELPADLPTQTTQTNKIHQAAAEVNSAPCDSSAAENSAISDRERRFYESVRPSRTVILDDLPPEKAAPRLGVLGDILSHLHYVDDIIRSYTAGFLGLIGFLVLSGTIGFGSYYISNNSEALFGPKAPIAAPHLIPPPTIAGDKEVEDDGTSGLNEESEVPGSAKSVSTIVTPSSTESEDAQLEDDQAEMLDANPSEEKQELLVEAEESKKLSNGPLSDVASAISAADYSLAKLRIEQLRNNPTKNLSQSEEELLACTKATLLISEDNIASRGQAFEIISRDVRIKDENIDRQLVTSYWLLTGQADERIEAAKKLGIVLPDTCQYMLCFKAINNDLNEVEFAALKRLSDLDPENPVIAFYCAVAHYYENNNEVCKSLLDEHKRVLQKLVEDSEASEIQRWIRSKVQAKFNKAIKSLKGRLDS